MKWTTDARVWPLALAAFTAEDPAEDFVGTGVDEHGTSFKASWTLHHSQVLSSASIYARTWLKKKVEPRFPCPGVVSVS
jgi:hypothetical protein